MVVAVKNVGVYPIFGIFRPYVTMRVQEWVFPLHFAA